MLERKVRRAAAARGLNEAVTWSFLPEREAEHFAEGNGGLWILENPISEDMKAMRPSLLPGLLAAAKRNSDRGADGVRLFEIGRRYLRGAAGRERRTGDAGRAARRRKDAARLGQRQGRRVRRLRRQGRSPRAARSGRRAGGQSHGHGRGGAAVPSRPVGDAAAWARRTFWRGSARCIPRRSPRSISKGPSWRPRLYLDAIPAKKGGGRSPAPAYAPPALQAVTRDFAFLVDAGLPAGDLLRAVKGADKANIVDARVFDDFRGQGVPEGQKSLAIEVVLQPAEKSYTDEALKAIADKIVASAAKLGAELRG